MALVYSFNLFKISVVLATDELLEELATTFLATLELEGLVLPLLLTDFAGLVLVDIELLEELEE